MDSESGDRRDITTQPERGRILGTKVRTTITPGEVIEVGDAELVDLDRQGLIHSREGDDGFVDDEPTEVESGVVTDSLEAELERSKTPDEPPAEDEDGEPGDGFAALATPKPKGGSK